MHVYEHSEYTVYIKIYLYRQIDTINYISSLILQMIGCE